MVVLQRNPTQNGRNIQLVKNSGHLKIARLDKPQIAFEIHSTNVYLEVYPNWLTLSTTILKKPGKKPVA